jgi:hypothetical protein
MSNMAKENCSSTLEQKSCDGRLSISGEFGFVSIIILVVLIVSSLPYIYGYLSSPPDKEFMGILMNVPDHWQYFSWMRELSISPLSADKLTPEPNNPVFFNLLWWMLGRSETFLGVGPIGMYQLLRVVSTVLFLLLIYHFCKRFFQDVWSRRLAFLVATFASGFGWFWVVIKYSFIKGDILFPFDVYTAEGNTFLGVMGHPHFIAAALYIYVFDLFLLGDEKKQYRYAVAAGLVAQFLGWQHAYDLISVYGVIGIYIILRFIRDRKFPKQVFYGAMILGLISWWPALYSVLLTSLDPLWKEVLKQFANAGAYTPNLLHLPILMGPAFLFALITFLVSKPYQLKGVDDKNLFIRGWFFITFFLIYLPVDYRIHLLNGWQVPIAILAVQGFVRYGFPWCIRLVGKIQTSSKRIDYPDSVIKTWLTILIIVVIIPTNLYLLAWRFVDLERHDYPYYLYKDEVKAISWLEKNVGSDDVVFSTLTIGQYIPALTGAYTFVGHWAQTVDYFGKELIVDEFYSTVMNDNERKDLLKRFSIDFVFYGPAERQVGDYPISDLKYLEKVYSSGQVDIFRVVE